MSGDLTFDEAEAIGLDGTGMNMDPRFPHKYIALTDEEKVRFWQYRIVSSGKDRRELYAMVERLETLAAATSGLYVTWISHDFEGDFIVPELGLPVSMSVDEAAAEIWHLTQVFGEALENVFAYTGRHRGVG